MTISDTQRPTSMPRFVAVSLAYIRDVWTRPFRSRPERVDALSLTERSQERRRAILRLFLFFTGSVILGVSIPLISFQHPSLATLAVLVALIAFSFGGLALAERNLTTVPALIFSVGGMVAATVFAFVNPNGISIPVLTGFVTFPLFILIAGLVLPVRLLAATTAFGVICTSIAFTVISARGSVFPTQAVQNGIGYQLISVQILTAILAWIAIRSANSGIREANEAYLRERELMELKDHFITDANHELRTPIMAWFNSTELLVAQGDRIAPERRQRLAERTIRAGEQVLHLLDNILDATVVEAQAPLIVPKRLLLAPLIHDIVSTFDLRTAGETGLKADMVGDRDFRLDIAPDLTVLADEARVRQILVNLISNALKYSPPDSPIAIAAEPTQAQDAQAFVAIHVRDAGLGVPPAEQRRLFQRFVRLERDIAGPVRGTGVGLFMCRVLVEAMGGRIWVASTGVPGEGSVFSFTLPASAITSAR